MPRTRDIVDVLHEVRNAYGGSLGTSISDLRRMAVHVVAERRSVEPNTIADIYIRRLRPDIRSTAEFDKLLEDWLVRGSDELLRIVRRHAGSVDVGLVDRLLRDRAGPVDSARQGESTRKLGNDRTVIGQHFERARAEAPVRTAKPSSAPHARVPAPASPEAAIEVGRFRVAVLSDASSGPAVVQVQVHDGRGWQLMHGGRLAVSGKDEAYDLVRALVAR